MSLARAILKAAEREITNLQRQLDNEREAHRASCENYANLALKHRECDREIAAAIQRAADAQRETAEAYAERDALLDTRMMGLRP